MKGKAGPTKGTAPKASMPVLSHAAKSQVVSAAKERKHGGKVVDYDKDKMMKGGRCDKMPRKNGGRAVLSGAASKAPMSVSATSTTSRPGMK